MPFDSRFQKNRKKVGKEGGIAVWGPVDPPQKLGIRGSSVAVDWDLCIGCGTCLSVCPMQLYDWKETPSHPTSERKPFPSRESECACCYRCENQCPVQAIRVVFGPPKTFTVAVPLMFAQITGSVVYGIVFGPYLGLSVLFYIGWLAIALGLPFFFSPTIYFPKAKKEKGVMDTTVVVDGGTYGIVRHPQVLGCFLFMAGAMLVSQHWLSMLVAVPVFILFSRYVLKEEKDLVVKFGDQYESYMQRVPRMNPLLGIIRLARAKRNLRG